MNFKSYIIITLLFSTTLTIYSQDKKWDVSNPPGEWNWKEVNFTTNEGTWMNLDVSPDGKTIVFDMLGDIYSIPVTGGKAKVLRTGIPFEIQPRFSPDGKKISFTSDAGGGDNIWTMNIDGSDAKQITKESFRLLNNAVWSSDGNYLIARKHFTSGRSLGAGEMWMYHITGGTGTQLTKRKNDQQDVNEPFTSTDGKYLYYCEDMYPGGYFKYNKDPNKQIYVIKRYSFADGKTEVITGGPGGAIRPTVSPNGKLLAFVKRVRTKSVLYIHNLETGEEYPVYDKLNKDQQEAWCLFGTYANFDWMPDNESIVFWAGGKVNSINIKTLSVKDIPFEVNATIKIAEALKFKNKAHQDNFTSKMIRNTVTSPDEKTIVFESNGKLWKKAMPNGIPSRLTGNSDIEAEASFSKDGKNIVFVTWNDEQTGAIHIVSAKGGKSKKITSEKGIYRTPSFSNDNSKIVFRKQNGNNEQGHAFCKNPGIYTISSKDGKMKKISSKGEFPTFTKDDKSIIVQTGGSYFGNLTKTLVSYNLNGKDEKTLISSKYANRLILSPDNEWIAFNHLHKVFIVPFPKSGQTINIDKNTSAVPVAQVARDAGISLHWSSDSKKLHWTLGEEYFTNELKDRFTFLPNSVDSIPAIDTVGSKINLSHKYDKPEGSIAFKNARIITMKGDEVIENGTIVIKENKIIAVGKANEVQVPADAKVYDVAGKTIMPGMVDVHAHIGAFRDGLRTQKHWQFYANLAYGVTTAHDPSANTETVFTLSEMQKTGELVGPRMYSTGFILYGADSDIKAVVNSLEDARSSIRRTKAFGAFSVKSYNQPRRDQRQQVIKAARELGILVVPEGGSTFYHNMTMIMDGHTGVEHNIPVAPVYKDVLTLWGESNTGYTPTLIVNYGGVNGEYYWYEKTNVWENEKLLKYYPRSIIDSRSRHRTMIPEEEYKNGHILVSQTCKNLSDNGVKVNLGAHGQIQGIGAHWELWMLAQGGMTNLEAIRSATLNGAYYIGMEKEIGSLEVGKLADLVIMDKNPLENIQNTNSIIYTMINGRLYDTETMNEIGNYNKPRTKFYWENSNYNGTFPWHEETNSFMGGECGCHVAH